MSERLLYFRPGRYNARKTAKALVRPSVCKERARTRNRAQPFCFFSFRGEDIK